MGRDPNLPIFFMKKIQLKILYSVCNYLVLKNKFPKICEKINILINKLENE